MSISPILSRTFFLVIAVLAQGVLAQGIMAMFGGSAMATERLYESEEKGATIIELYTSQGCSSCPPAEAWLNTFSDAPSDGRRLWKDIIPINFHVDYWDHIGWKDPFSSSEFSQRQRNYNRHGHTHNVATPGFVVDGLGWRGWGRGQEIPRHMQSSKRGALRAELNGDALVIEYRDLTQAAQSSSPTKHYSTRDLKQSTLGKLYVHIARLGIGIETHVLRGENAGRNLRHDFVVTGYRKARLELGTAGNSQVVAALIETTSITEATTAAATDAPAGIWNRALVLPEALDVDVQREALAIWVTESDDPKPLQIAAGWL